VPFYLAVKVWYLADKLDLTGECLQSTTLSLHSLLLHLPSSVSMDWLSVLLPHQEDRKSSRGRSNVQGIVGHNLADCPLQATGCLEQSWRCIDLVTKCACCTTFTHSRSTYRVVESAIGVWTSLGAEEKLISASVFCRHWSQCTQELIHNKQPKDASSCPRTNVPNCFTSVRASLHGSLESTTLSAAQKP